MRTRRNKRTGLRAGSQRSCASCHQRLPRAASLRVVRDPTGKLIADCSGRLPGRGMHLCPDFACLYKAHERKAAGRAFRAATSFEDPAQLAGLFLADLGRRVQALLQVSAQAGWLWTGPQAVAQAIARGQAALVLLTEAAPATLTAELDQLRRGRRIPQVCLALEAAAYSTRDGSRPAVLAVRHRGMARRLRSEATRALRLSTSLQEWENNQGAVDRANRPREDATSAAGLVHKALNQQESGKRKCGSTKSPKK